MAKFADVQYRIVGIVMMLVLFMLSLPTKEPLMIAFGFLIFMLGALADSLASD